MRVNVIVSSPILPYMSVQRFFSCQGFFEVRRAKDTEQIPPLLKAIVCEKEASKGVGGKERRDMGEERQKRRAL